MTSSSASRRLLATGLSVVLCAVTGLPAAERTHTVRSGESASSLAKRYYGDHELAGHLLRYNGKSGTIIHVGETLRIPDCPVHRVRAGDTWSVLAQRYLGNASLYRAIASLNGLSPEDPLRIGDEIVIPVSLPHELKRGETLAVLAERFYGTTDLGVALQSFNEIDDPRRLSVGQTVRIPLISFRIKDGSAGKETSRPDPPAAGTPLASGKPAIEKGTTERKGGDDAHKPAVREDTAGRAAEEGSGKRTIDKEAAGPVITKDAGKRGVEEDAGERASEGKGGVGESDRSARREAAVPEPGKSPPVETPPRPRFDAELRAAAEAFRGGDYDRARTLLESLKGPVTGSGSSEDRGELWRLLSFVYVAFDLPERACTAHRAAVAVSGQPTFDADVVSPKILRILSTCAGGRRPAVAAGRGLGAPPGRSDRHE